MVKSILVAAVALTLGACCMHKQPVTCTQPCAGDCNADCVVTDAEIATVNAIISATAALAACPAADSDHDGAVTNGDLFRAIDSKKQGCR